jgi:hypothetical protein
MKQPLSDELRVRHVLDSIQEVESYLLNISLDEFLANSEKRFATIKQIEIVGEACARISSRVKDKYPEIEWKNIVGFEISPFMNILVSISRSSGKLPRTIFRNLGSNSHQYWMNLLVVKLLFSFKVELR